MRRFAVLFVVTVLLVLTSTATAGGDKNRGEIGTGDTYENGCEDQPCFADAPKPGTLDALITEAADPNTELDETEVQHLQFIREEEKMARDVYLVLYEKWGNPVFAIIAESEQAQQPNQQKGK